VLLVWTLMARDRLALALSLVVLALGWTQTDLNVHVFLPQPTPAASAATIKVFNWNTRFWNEENDTDFYSFLRSQDADVYQLQEYWDRNGRTLDLRPELEKAFPGYRIAISDELVTASRLPVLAQHGDVPGRFLRVDVRAGDQQVSFYNVHISMQLGADMAGIFHNRQAQFSRLQSDLAQNADPAYVSGDFNSTTSMGVMRWLLGHYQDSVQAGAAFIPRTWAFHLLPELRLWRLDFNLVDQRLAVTGYRDIDPGAKSDHWAQLVQIGYTSYAR
jgi:endonuclease/exonuclease/phosphatase (EEP) superfamily protein YafD